MEKKHCTAVVLAAGKGTRMGTSVAKQYLKIEDIRWRPTRWKPSNGRR